MSSRNPPSKKQIVETILLLPTSLLISQILQLNNTEHFLFHTEKKTPLPLTIMVWCLILCLFSVIALLFHNEYQLSTVSTEGQILLLTALAILTGLPFIQYTG